MRPPDPAVLLDCGHVEHPQASSHCQTIDCPNYEDRHPLWEWISALTGGLLLWWVQWETGQGVIEIYLDRLPSLF